MKDANYFNDICRNTLVEHLAITVTDVAQDTLCAEMRVTPEHLAPNGYLHARSLVS